MSVSDFLDKLEQTPPYTSKVSQIIADIEEAWAGATDEEKVEIIVRGAASDEMIREAATSTNPALRESIRRRDDRIWQEYQSQQETWRVTLITLARAAIPELSKLRDNTSYDDLMIKLAKIRPGWAIIKESLEKAYNEAGEPENNETWREIFGLREDQTIDDAPGVSAYGINQLLLRWALKRNAPGWEIETPAGVDASDTGWIDRLSFFTISTLLQIELERRQANFEKGEKALKQRRQKLPVYLPQPTFHEIRNASIALADGPTGRNWEQVLGETALRHVIPGEPLQTKLVAGVSLQWWGTPFTYDELFQGLKEAGAPAALFLEIIVSYVIQEGTFTVKIDDLIKMIGWDMTARLNKEKRNQCRRQVWQWLLMCADLIIIGARPGTYRDPDTKEKEDLTSNDPFIMIAGKKMPKQMTFDGSETPREITIAPGEWIDRFRGKRHILPDFGNVLLLAGIPADKPSGAWAQAIGMTLNQKWREASAARVELSHAGEENKLTVRYPPFTRRELLETIPPRPEFDVRTILNGPNPKRAQEYWKKAISILKRRGQIGHCVERSRIPTTRTGWKEAWLDQKLDIRPKEEGLQATAEIHKKAKEARRARTRKGAQKK